jgi:hypothetical protein
VRFCEEPGCGRRHWALGKCHYHWQRARTGAIRARGPRPEPPLPPRQPKAHVARGAKNKEMVRKLTLAGKNKAQIAKELGISTSWVKRLRAALHREARL